MRAPLIPRRASKGLFNQGAQHGVRRDFFSAGSKLSYSMHHATAA